MSINIYIFQNMPWSVLNIDMIAQAFPISVCWRTKIPELIKFSQTSLLHAEFSWDVARSVGGNNVWHINKENIFYGEITVFIYATSQTVFLQWSVLSIGNPLRLLTTVSKDAGYPHPNWNLVHTHPPTQTCLLQPKCVACGFTPCPKTFIWVILLKLPRSAAAHQCPKSCKIISIKFRMSKVRKGYLCWPCGRMCGQCLRLTSEHTCRCGIHREDSWGT